MASILEIDNVKEGDSLVFDIESSGLLDETAIDYNSSPYRLRDSFQIWCVVVKDLETDAILTFVGDEIKTQLPVVMKKAGTIIAHNGINFDLLATKLYLGLDYTISRGLDQSDTFCGKDVSIVDTLCWSKALNPDRLGGHSLDEWGNRVGYNKINWRKEAIELGLIKPSDPKGAEFGQYHPKMLEYCIRDVEVTELTFKALIAERGDWPWDDALNLEQAVMDIITRQSHRGFWFDKTLAEANVHELDELMEVARIKVEPILPAKPLTKTLEKLYTPPKVQVKKDGSLSAAIVKWVEKHEGKVLDDRTIEVFGTTYSIPMPQESIVKEQPAKMKDTTHIKGWLVSMGWDPINWKERDLSVDTKKQKLSPEKLEETIQRYVEQTLNSPFCDARCEFLDTTPDMLLHKLRSGKPGRGLKVRTNPSFTVGQDKEICPNLDAMKEKFPYTQDIVNFLTYQHRRNSILGGGYDPDDDEEEFDKGYLANVRSDGRIATPADTCGAGTSRFKHKGVANIPRVTSLYGDKMRAMFGVERAKMIQFGYDFDSLEAKIEAHYTYKYDDANKTYGVSLIAEKPNDIHSVTAKKISLIIHKEFSRANAKSVKYGLR